MRMKAARPTRSADGASEHARGQLPSRLSCTLAPRGPVGSLLRLQRAVGNRATGQLIQLCRDGHT